MGGLVYAINRNAVLNLLTRNIESTVETDAHYIEKNFPNLELLLSDGTQSPLVSDYLEKALADREVERYKLYNNSGTLVFDSQQLPLRGSQAEGLIATAPPAEIMQALTKKVAVSRLVGVTAESGSSVMADVFVPIMRDGKVLGVAEVYEDQTVAATSIDNSFLLSTALVAALAALGCAVPAFGFHLRSKQKQEADANLRFLANHDPLTALPNRTNFNASLIHGLNMAQDDNKKSALHFIDLDFFKDLNDRHGHDFGDEVLRAVAERLNNALRGGDIVSRFGGDEFVVAQFGFTSDEQITNATNRIIRIFKEPIQIRNSEITLTASIGTAISPMNGQSAEKLIKSADTALYVVKARGRNSHCYYESKFDEEKSKRLSLEVIVRDAVAKQSFELNFQPLFIFQDKSLKGFEALLRLKDKSGKPVSPADFIPVAEEIGMIDEIGTWVLNNACTTAATWPNNLQVSVNLSVAQFKRRSIVASTKAALAKSGLAANRLLLEITESLLMTETDIILEQLNELKALGVAIVMDDFGTGYSSLGYMLKFPFDRIKIDRSFVNQLENGNENAKSVVETIIALGHTLRMNVTAEGVETVGQANALRDMNCDDAQGYLYGKPMEPTEIPAMLLKNFIAQSVEKSVEAEKPLVERIVA